MCYLLSSALTTSGCCSSACEPLPVLHPHVCLSLTTVCPSIPVPPVDEANNVKVEFVYEPPQSGAAEALSLERHTPEEAQVGFRVYGLGGHEDGWQGDQLALLYCKLTINL